MINDALVGKIDELLLVIEATHPSRDSLEWYLMNNLKSYKAAVQLASDKLSVENAARAFNRFCTESMDWQTELFKRCAMLADFGLQMGRSSQ